jgi:hypothetical protein
MYLIHGMSDKHRIKANDPSLDIVVGYGAGSPDSYSCDPWRKDAFINLLKDNGLCAYEGKKGGQMSGWAKNNMNQLFRKWYTDPAVQSMQIEIVHELRADNDTAQLTAEYLAVAMSDMLGKPVITETTATNSINCLFFALLEILVQEIFVVLSEFEVIEANGQSSSRR